MDDATSPNLPSSLPLVNSQPPPDTQHCQHHPVGWYFSVPARIPMGSADAWVQDWWTHVTSVSPMTNEPSVNVLGPACAISVCSATVPGHVGPFRVLCLGPGLLCN